MNKNFLSNQGRRSFMKKSSLIAGGILAAPLISRLPIIFQAASDVIKIALIGCGGRGTGAATPGIKHQTKCTIGCNGRCF